MARTQMKPAQASSAPQRPRSAESLSERLARSRKRFIDRFFLRFHMVVILGGAFFGGVVGNVLLFHAGVRSLLYRYPLAVLCAYGAFFLLIRLWLSWIAQQGRTRPSADRGSSGPDLGDLLSAIPDGSAASPRLGGGGFSGGGGGQSGGAGATFDDETPAALQAALAQPQANPGLGPALGSGSSSSGSSRSGSVDLDGEGAVLVIVFGVLAAAIFGAGLYLVYDAPDILSDAALQLALASGLWRGSRQLVSGSWAAGVLRRTVVPFAVVFALALLAGAVAGHLCPSGTRLSEVYQQCVVRQ